MELKAIDVHVHPWDEVSLASMGGGRKEIMAKYFGRDIKPVSMAELADQYRSRKMMAVLLASDDSTSSGLPPVPNDHVARAVKDHPDVFLGFAGVDPWKGKLAIDEAKRAKEGLGLVGLKFNPGRQFFFANDAPVPDGLDWEQLTDLLRPLCSSPALAGFSLGCYNPEKDREEHNGHRIVEMFRAALSP